MKTVFMVNKVWDIVKGTRLCPPPPPVLRLATSSENGNEALVNAALQSIDDFENATCRAACLLQESISDTILYSVTSIIDDPAATWRKLQQKFARRSELEHEAAQKAFLSFQHNETESADETITRFEAVVERALQQNVAMSTQQIERALLSEPNDRYSALKSNYQYSQVKPDIDQLCESMRDEDLQHKKKHSSPAHGAAAFADAVEAAAVQRLEVLWAQKQADSVRPPGGRPGASSSICYCCGDRGHYARDCRLARTRCKFCQRTGHLEKMCQKKKREGGEGEASFFHGARSSSVDFTSGGDGHALASEAEIIDVSASILAASHMHTTSTTWLCDSGASHHICHCRDMFSTIEPMTKKFRIKQVEGFIDIKFHGTVILHVDSAGGKQQLTLSNVLLIETMQFNIFSLQKLLAADWIYTFNLIPGKAVVQKPSSTGNMEQVALLTRSKEGRLTLDCTTPTSGAVLPTSRAALPQHDYSTTTSEAVPTTSRAALQAEVMVATLSMDLLHRRLGHSGEAALRRLLREDMATGISKVQGKISPCDSCQLAKITRPPHPAVQFDHGTSHPLQLVVMDLAGPVTPASLGGASYFLGLMDVFTRHSWVYVIKRKSDAAAKIFEWKALVENQCKQRLLNLRSDNGGEFTSSDFKHQMAVLGVSLQTTPPYSPESNSIAERFNRTVQEKTRTIMLAAALPSFLWGEILQAANMIRNMSPVSHLSSTPFELWTGRRPDLSKLRVLGCKAFCPLHKHAREGKFGARGYKGVLVNYSSSSPAYRVYDWEKKKVYDVAAPHFDEEVGPGWWRVPDAEEEELLSFPPSALPPAAPAVTASEVIDPTSPDNGNGEVQSAPAPVSITGAAADDLPGEEVEAVEEPAAAAADDVPGEEEDAVEEVVPEVVLRRSLRENRGVPPIRMKDMLMLAVELDAADPKTFKQAMRLPDANLWRGACAAEVASLRENNVFTVVPQPSTKPVITSKWVFKRKRGLSGEVEKYKARVVARGFLQQEGVDFGETYAPTVRMESIRLMIAAAAAEGMHLQQMDVTTAFLYAELEEEVYLEVPEGMFEGEQPGKVLRLWKALYGLKQSSRMWNLHVDRALSEFGLVRLTADFCVYAVHAGADRTLLGLFVDDMFIIGRCMEKIRGVKGFLNSRFKMKDLGEAVFLLGMEIRRLPGGDLQLVQEKYLGEVLARYPVDSSRSASTPLPPGSKLSGADSPKTQVEVDEMGPIPYRSAIGSLMYLAVCTRPDIAAAVSSLSRFNGNPGRAHWEGVQHVLRYLQGTSGEGLIYRKGESTRLWGYCDASYLTCPDTGRCRGGYVFLSAGAAVSWQSKLIPNASLSSCESEYLQFGAATTEASFLRQLQEQMVGSPAAYAVRICVDSQPALDILNNPVYHARTKQILARYHFVRDRVLVEKEVVFEKITSGQMGADMLTKHAAVGVVRFNKKLVGLSSW